MNIEQAYDTALESIRYRLSDYTLNVFQLHLLSDTEEQEMKNKMIRLKAAMKILTSLKDKIVNCRCQEMQNFRNKYSEVMSEYQETFVIPSYKLEAYSSNKYNFRFCPFCGNIMGLKIAQKRGLLA